MFCSRRIALITYLEQSKCMHCNKYDHNSGTIAIIVGSSIGGACLVFCLIAIITIARIICYAKKSNQHTATNTTAGATSLSTAYTAVGQTFNQPGFQIQNCGIKLNSSSKFMIAIISLGL